MNPARRRWSFSLRTMFVAMTLVCCWLGYYHHWIRQRHRLLADEARIAYTPANAAEKAWIPCTSEFAFAPWPLDLLGEEGIATITYYAASEDADTEYRRLKSLFPESQLRRASALSRIQFEHEMSVSRDRLE